jgi:glycine cleavage system H protein
MNIEVIDGIHYTRDHEWAKVEGNGHVRVGITAFAVDALGDITLVDVAKVGTEVTAGKAFGTVESVKTLSDLFAPISGTIVEVNGALIDKPELVNDSTYNEGWMVAIAPSRPTEIGALMDAASYRSYIATLDH